MDNTEKNEVLTVVNEILVSVVGLNTKIDSMQEQASKIPEMQNQITEMQKEVAKIPEMQNQITEMQKEVAKIPEMQNQIIELQKETRNINKNIAVIENRQTELQKETRNISRSVAVIEHVHGDKLKALFDAFTTNTEKIGTEEKRISICERKIENHDTDIYYLKTKVQGL